MDDEPTAALAASATGSMGDIRHDRPEQNRSAVVDVTP
jgi:hypothetical protein